MADYIITEYGAKADGVTNNAEYIQRAIDEASVKGGRVVIPAGEYLSGTIVLKSNVELYLDNGAVLISSLNEKDILDFAKLFEDDNECTGWDGGCFLFASHEKNITISGNGTIYGQGDKVFFDDDVDNGFHECPLNVTAFRPRTTFLEDVENLTVKDVTIKDAAFWTLHMAGCRHVMIRNVRILNDVRGANNDGIDPDSCQDVVISDCIVKTGDDAIVLKSTKPMAKKYGACENIVIHNCVLYSHDSALKIGTETHGDIRNVVFSDSVVKDCSRGVGIWVRDGATIENIHVHHLTGNVLKYADGVREAGPSMWWGNGEALFINSTYRNAEHNWPGKIRDIHFDHISMTVESCCFIGGEKDAVIEDISLEKMLIIMKKQGTQESGYFDEQPSEHHVYKHVIPAFYARNAKGVSIEAEVRYEDGYSEEKNPLYLFDECDDMETKIMSRN